MRAATDSFGLGAQQRGQVFGGLPGRAPVFGIDLYLLLDAGGSDDEPEDAVAEHLVDRCQHRGVVRMLEGMTDRRPGLPERAQARIAHCAQSDRAEPGAANSRGVEEVNPLTSLVPLGVDQVEGERLALQWPL